MWSYGGLCAAADVDSMYCDLIGAIPLSRTSHSAGPDFSFITNHGDKGKYYSDGNHIDVLPGMFCDAST